MTELERLLVGCHTFADGKVAFDAEAAGKLADWLLDNGRERDAKAVRDAVAYELRPWWNDVTVHYPRTDFWTQAIYRRDDGRGPYSLSVALEGDGWHPKLALTLVNESALTDACGILHREIFAAQLFTCDEDPAEEGQPPMGVERHAEILSHLPRIKLAAIRHVLGYDADRLLALCGRAA